MRSLPVLAAAMTAGLAATACTYVERERPAPVVVQQPVQPSVVQTPPPAVTVRPSY